MTRLPERTRTYQCHHMDSTRWDYFERRPGDIVIGTSYKAGTTWTQAIVAHLLFPDGEMPATPAQMSPWLDMRLLPLEAVLNLLRSQQHRRFIKTHLPLDGLIYDPEVKYVYVSRDARDVCMSLWNHYTHMTDETVQLMNMIPAREGDEFPPPPEDVRTFWRRWMSQGWFEWESEGYPYWGHLANVQSWFDYRHLPNLELFHYQDMLDDTEGEMRRMAAFLEIDVPEAAWPAIVKAVSFQEMKNQGERYVPGGGEFWKGGAQTFLNKGTNGRWRDVLTDEDLALYEEACARVLTPECRAWLEEGRRAVTAG